MISTTVLTRAGSMLAWRRHRPVLHVAGAALRAVRTAHSASPRPRPFPCPASFASRAKRRFVSMGEAVVGNAGRVGATSLSAALVSLAGAPSRDSKVGPRAGTRA